MAVVVGLEGIVAIPVEPARDRRIGAVDELHEANPLFQKAPGQQTVAREARQERVGVARAVERVRGGALVAQVAGLGARGGCVYPLQAQCKPSWGPDCVSVSKHLLCVLLLGIYRLSLSEIGYLPHVLARATLQ